MTHWVVILRRGGQPEPLLTLWPTEAEALAAAGHWLRWFRGGIEADVAPVEVPTEGTPVVLPEDEPLLADAALDAAKEKA